MSFDVILHCIMSLGVSFHVFSHFSATLSSKDNSGAEAVKRENQEMMDKEIERDFARYRFSNGLQELALIAPPTREVVVALASKNIPGLMADRSFIIDTAWKK